MNLAFFPVQNFFSKKKEFSYIYSLILSISVNRRTVDTSCVKQRHAEKGQVSVKYCPLSGQLTLHC